ncbi:MAG: hypothetical protein MJ250_08710 [Alphaproteobacteria bacterium]|nr:hypothetical protein [Alphaproteobacteria bacterium]
MEEKTENTKVVELKDEDLETITAGEGNHSGNFKDCEFSNAPKRVGASVYKHIQDNIKNV